MSTKRTQWDEEAAEDERTRGPAPRTRLVTRQTVDPGAALALAARLISWATSARSAKNHEPHPGGTIPERLEWRAHGERVGYHRATVEHRATLARLFAGPLAKSDAEALRNAVLSYLDSEIARASERL